MKKPFLNKFFFKKYFDLNFFKRSLKILLPIILSSLILTTISFVDNIMVSNFKRIDVPEKTDFAAVGIGNEIWYALEGIPIAITIVFGVIYSQFSHNKKVFVETARLNFWIFMITTIFINLLMFFGANSLVSLFFLSPGKDVVYVKEIATRYIKILSLGSIFFSATLLIMNPLSIKGKTLYALYLSLISLVLNIFFNYIFIYLLNEGSEGSAWATNISYFVQFIIALIFLFKNRKWFSGFWKIFTLSKFVTKEIFKRYWLFISFILMQFSFGFSTIIWVSLYSSDLIKSLSVGYLVGEIMFSLLVATNRGVKIFIGPLLGKKQFQKAKEESVKLFYTNLFLMLIFMILGLTSMIFFPQAMLINDDNIKMAQWIILCYCISFLGLLIKTYLSAIFETSGSQWVPNIWNYFFQVWAIMPLSVILSSFVLGNYGLSFEMNFLISTNLIYLPAIVLIILYRKYSWLKNIE